MSKLSSYSPMETLIKKKLARWDPKKNLQVGNLCLLTGGWTVFNHPLFHHPVLILILNGLDYYSWDFHCTQKNESATPIPIPSFIWASFCKKGLCIWINQSQRLDRQSWYPHINMETWGKCTIDKLGLTPTVSTNWDWQMAMGQNRGISKPMVMMIIPT